MKLYGEGRLRIFDNRRHEERNLGGNFRLLFICNGAPLASLQLKDTYEIFYSISHSLSIK